MLTLGGGQPLSIHSIRRTEDFILGDVVAAGSRSRNSARSSKNLFSASRQTRAVLTEALNRPVTQLPSRVGGALV
jgi:hypothetical protein